MISIVAPALNPPRTAALVLGADRSRTLLPCTVPLPNAADKVSLNFKYWEDI